MTESKLQAAIIKTLSIHPQVKWCMVITSGTFKKGRAYMNIGSYHYQGESHAGVSDIIGQLIDGSVLALEVKLPGEKPSKAQYKFLNIVNVNNGVSGWCDSVKAALDIIEQALNGVSNK